MLFGGVCLLTGGHLSPLSIEEGVRQALDAGVGWIQYREKGLSRREVFLQAERLRRLTDEYRAVLVINDYPDIALAVDADGVHLGQDDLPLTEARRILRGKLIGISTHDIPQAKEAERGCADYVGFGPVFSTETKDAGTPKGLMELGKVIPSVKIPVVAIGGIKRENLRDVLSLGVSAVAVASGILKSGDIYRESMEFVKIIRGYETV